MHKQKTIAKWLAVILLMTIAVASYVVLSALSDGSSDKNQNVAGANDTGNPDSPMPAPQPKPIYSVLPRKSETVHGASVAHVGGEGNETVLDAFDFANKTVLVFRSESTQYDVKESGIYIAIFSETTLEKVLRISGKDDAYAAHCITRKGVAIFLGDATATTVRIYDENFDVVCQNTLGAYDAIEANYSKGKINAFCLKDGLVRHVVLDDALRISTDTFLMQTESATFVQTIEYGDKTLLFLQDGAVALGAIFCDNTGFTKRFSLNKHSFLQIMPVANGTEQSFVAMFETQDGLSLYLLSSTLEFLAKYTAENEKCGVLLRCESSLNLLCKTRSIRLCSHLDFISESPLPPIDGLEKFPSLFSANGASFSSEKSLSSALSNSNFSLENATNFSCVLQEENLFVARFENADILLKHKDGKLRAESVFEYANSAIVSLGKSKDGTSRISLFFDCDSSTDTTYMCFGKTDAFFISVLTSDV